MWRGEGWQRTQRQLGVLGFIVCAVVDTVTSLSVPIAVYSGLFGLLGLDVLSEALERMRK